MIRMFNSFPFTFDLTVPGLINPFSSTSAPDAPFSSTSSSNPSSSPQNYSRSTSDSDSDSDGFERSSRSGVPNSSIRGSGLAGRIPTSNYSMSNQFQSQSQRIRIPNVPSHNRPRPSFSPSPSPSLSTFTGTHLHPNLGSRMHNQGNSPSPGPLSRKRGWEPSESSPSASAATLALTNGYLDTPAKYREMAGMHAGLLSAGGGSEWGNKKRFEGRMWTEEEEELRTIRMSDDHELQRRTERELGLDDLPPAKRRRGLAGSIVSTALSAALIGTAVGLTVYRLWRDRGKQQQSGVEGASTNSNTIDSQESQGSSQPSSPPPPYQYHQIPAQGGWTAIEHRDSQSPLLPTPRKKNVQAVPRSAKKVKPVKRERPIAHRSSRGRGKVSASLGVGTIMQAEFDFGTTSGREVVEEEPVEDKMDWIGGKLAQLIEEGKKALGREVVVMSDAKEDEVDDGTAGWIDQDHDISANFGVGRSSSRSNSIKRNRRPKALGLGSPQYLSSSLPVSGDRLPSPEFNNGNGCVSRRTHPYGSVNGQHSRGLSQDSAGVTSSLMEDSTAWESEAMRELMEKARARARAGRG